MEIISFCTICVHVSYSKFVVNNHHIFLTFFLTKFSFLVLPCLSLTFESEVPVIDLNNQFQKVIDEAKKCAMLSDLAEKKNTSTMQSKKLSTTQAENTSSNASGDRKDSVSSESVMSHVQSFEKKISEFRTGREAVARTPILACGPTRAFCANGCGRRTPSLDGLEIVHREHQGCCKLEQRHPIGTCF